MKRQAACWNHIFQPVAHASESHRVPPLPARPTSLRRRAIAIPLSHAAAAGDCANPKKQTEKPKSEENRGGVCSSLGSTPSQLEARTDGGAVAPLGPQPAINPQQQQRLLDNDRSPSTVLCTHTHSTTVRLSSTVLFSHSGIATIMAPYMNSPSPSPVSPSPMPVRKTACEPRLESAHSSVPPSMHTPIEED